MKLLRVGFLWVLCLGLLACIAQAQIIRSPRMNLEYHRAQAAWKSGGSLLEAKARLDRVIEAGPEDAEAYLLRARVELALQHHSDALIDAQRAAELNPDLGDAHYLLCQAARLAGDSTLAVQALDRSIATIESDPHKHIVLSREAMLLGQHDTSESLARVAVALDGTNPEAHYQLARALAVRGNRDASVLLLTRGLDEGLLTPEYIGQDAVFDSTGVSAMALGSD